MKKVIAIILILAMLFIMAACGSRQTADSVVKLIDAIGEVTSKSGDAIDTAQQAYDSLSETERKNVSNHIKLLQAHTKYVGLKLLLEVEELKASGKADEAKAKIEAEKAADSEAYWEYLRIAGDLTARADVDAGEQQSAKADENDPARPDAPEQQGQISPKSPADNTSQNKETTPGADARAKEILTAIKDGNFEFVIKPPAEYLWSMGTQDQPLQKYTHAYCTYCSYFDNMGGNTVYKCNDTFKVTTQGQGSPFTSAEVTEMTELSYAAANKMAQDLIAKRSADVSEYQIAQETAAYIKNFYKKCSKEKYSGKKGLPQIESDHVYKVLIEKQKGNNPTAALNMVLEAQGIEAYGLMFTNRGCHSMLSIALLDGKLYICDPIGGTIMDLNEIPDTWNLSAIYSNIDLIFSIMGIEPTEESIDADLSVLGKENLVESLDGDIRLYVDYISADTDETETYCIKAQGPNSGSFAKYKILFGLASRIVVCDAISFEDLRTTGITVSIDSSTKALIDPRYEGLGFFAEGIK